MNIYVGNLSRDTSEDGLKQAFAAFGEVSTVKIIVDKFTGVSKGFGFVEMPDNTAGQSAITGLSGKELDGRPLTVNEARPREDRPSRGPGGGGGGRGRRPGGGGGFGGGGGGRGRFDR